MDRADPSRDVGGELHHLHNPTLLIENRIVGGLDPDFFPALADTLEFLGYKLATAQPVPECLVVAAARIGRIDEHRVVLALDLGQVVTERHAEILVGVQDSTLKIELDHGLRARDRRDLAVVIGGFHLRFSDVGGEFHNLVRLAATALDRIIGGLDPDLLSALADAHIFARVEFAAAELFPELPVVAAARIIRLDEHGVVLADDLGGAIAQSLAEIGIRGQNLASHVEFDDGKRFVDGGEDQFRVVAESHAAEHKVSPKGTPGASQEMSGKLSAILPIYISAKPNAHSAHHAR